MLAGLLSFFLSNFHVLAELTLEKVRAGFQAGGRLTQGSTKLGWEPEGMSSGVNHLYPPSHLTSFLSWFHKGDSQLRGEVMAVFGWVTWALSKALPNFQVTIKTNLNPSPWKMGKYETLSPDGFCHILSCLTSSDSILVNISKLKSCGET